LGLLSLFLLFIYYFKQKRLAKVLELKKQQKLLQLKSTFLENLSPEIRTPIISIIGNLSFIKEPTFDPKKAIYYTGQRFKNSQKMIPSLNRFLMLLKPEKAIKHNINRTSHKINFFIKEVISSFQPDLKVKKMLSITNLIS
jgi:signal transduction histidine kinase